jgi:hypothetical protein
MLLSMPIGFDVVSDGDEVLTTLGPMCLAAAEAIADSKEEALETAAQSYFPRWGEGFGADFYRGLALNAMWMRIGWSAPADDEEWEEIERVLGWCAEAERLGAEPHCPLGPCASLGDCWRRSSRPDCRRGKEPVIAAASCGGR